MTKNLGKIDIVIRIILGLGLISLFFWLDGPHMWWGLAGVILLATVILGFCPIYKMLGYKGTNDDF